MPPIFLISGRAIESLSLEYLSCLFTKENFSGFTINRNVVIRFYVCKSLHLSYLILHAYKFIYQSYLLTPKIGFTINT